MWSIACGVLGGCDSSISAKDYSAYLADETHGFRQSVVIEPYQIQVEYQPAVYTAYRKTYSKSNGNSEQYSQQLKEDKQIYFFQLKLSRTNGNDIFYHLAQSQEDYQRWVYYFSYTFQKRIFLQQGGEKYPCILYHFERSYDLQGGRTMVLGFENPNQLPSPGTLIIEAPLLDISHCEIPFTIEEIPELTF